jgi:molecular chaperone DnaJ
MPETFYDRLDVSADASTAAIEAAYREAIKEVHPDVSDDVDASERTKRLNRAKRVLADETERARYDRLGHEAYTTERPGTDGASETQPEDVTSETTGDDTQRRAHRGGPTATDRRADPSEPADRHRRGAREGESGPGQKGRRGRGSPGPGPAWPTGAGTTTGPSRGSQGPAWQSQNRTAAGGVDSPSARRQAAAGSTDGPNVDWSWNAWERTRSWAVREGEPASGPYPSRLFPATQSFVLLASSFLLYPVFVVAILFPPFPLAVRGIVAVCTLLMFAYLLSIPEVAIFVYGVWSVLVPVFVFLTPGLDIFSVAGVVGLSATWVPLGLSALTYAVLRP